MKQMESIARLPYLLSIVQLLAACKTTQPSSTPRALTATPTPAAVPVGQPAYWPTNSWRTSTPKDQGMDSEILAKMSGKVAK